MYTFENDPEGDQYDTETIHEAMIDELVDLVVDYSSDCQKSKNLPNSLGFKYGYLGRYNAYTIQGLIKYLEDQAMLNVLPTNN